VEDQLRQKGREDWLILGDRNSRLFYSAIKAWNSTNNIQHLIDDKGNHITKLEEIKVMAPKCYEALFN